MVVYYPADDLRDIYTSWDAERQQFITHAKKHEELYYGDVESTRTIFTKEQLKNIEKTTNLPIGINYLFPQLNQALGILLQEKPSTKTIGVTDAGSQYTEIIDKFKHHILYNSSTFQQTKQAIKNMLITGLGILHIGLVKDKTSFNLKLSSLHHGDVLLDPNTTTEDFTSSEGYFIEKEISLLRAIRNYAGLLTEIKEKFDFDLDMRNFSTVTRLDERGSSITTEHKKGYVTVREFYTKVDTVMYYIPIENNIEYVFAENLEPEQLPILDTAINIKEGSYLKRFLQLGDYVVDETILPTTENTIVPLYYEWGGKPYLSNGMMHFNTDNQLAYNRMLHFYLQGAFMNSTGGHWMATPGNIPPEYKTLFEDFGTDPTVVKYFIPQIINGILIKPERTNNNPADNSLLGIMAEVKQASQSSTGINPIVAGNPSEAPIETFSTARQYQDAATLRLGLIVKTFNESFVRLSNGLIQLLLSVLEPNIYYSFVNEEGEAEQINISLEQLKSIRMVEWNVISIPDTLQPSERFAAGMEMFKIAQTSQDPYERKTYVNEAYNNLDIKGFKKLAQKMDVVEQLKQEVNSLSEQVERDKELLKQFENRAMNAEYKAKLAQMLSQTSSDLKAKEVELEKDMEIKSLQEEIKDKKNNSK